MKTIFATALLFFTAGACFAGPQPVQRHSNSNFLDILTYNNVTIGKQCKSTPGSKLYTIPIENTPCIPQTVSLPANIPANGTSSQTFTPNPLVNYYKEIR